MARVIGFLKALILLPLGLVLVLLAVTNREPTPLSIDVFNTQSPDATLTLPLFLWLFAAVAIGVVVGSATTWLNQAKHRRAAKAHRREADRLHDELMRVRSAVVETADDNIERWER